MSAREIERLYQVQHDLLVKLQGEITRRAEEEALAEYKGRCLGLLKQQRLWWPVRLVQIGWRPMRRRRWFGRHGSEQWYGVVQYVRVGPLLFQLGHRPDLLAEEVQYRQLFSRRRGLATLRGEQEAARALRTVNRRHEHAE